MNPDNVLQCVPVASECKERQEANSPPLSPRAPAPRPPSPPSPPPLTPPPPPRLRCTASPSNRIFGFRRTSPLRLWQRVLMQFNNAGRLLHRFTAAQPDPLQHPHSQRSLGGRGGEGGVGSSGSGRYEQRRGQHPPPTLPQQARREAPTMEVDDDRSALYPALRAPATAHLEAPLPYSVPTAPEEPAVDSFSKSPLPPLLTQRHVRPFSPKLPTQQNVRPFSPQLPSQQNIRPFSPQLPSQQNVRPFSPQLPTQQNVRPFSPQLDNGDLSETKLGSWEPAAPTVIAAAPTVMAATAVTAGRATECGARRSRLMSVLVGHDRAAMGPKDSEREQQVLWTMKHGKPPPSPLRTPDAEEGSLPSSPAAGRRRHRRGGSAGGSGSAAWLWGAASRSGETQLRVRLRRQRLVPVDCLVALARVALFLLCGAVMVLGAGEAGFGVWLLATQGALLKAALGGEVAAGAVATLMGGGAHLGLAALAGLVSALAPTCCLVLHLGLGSTAAAGAVTGALLEQAYEEKLLATVEGHLMAEVAAARTHAFYDLALHGLQRTFGCCGVHNFSDWCNDQQSNVSKYKTATPRIQEAFHMGKPGVNGTNSKLTAFPHLLTFSSTNESDKEFINKNSKVDETVPRIINSRNMEDNIVGEPKIEDPPPPRNQQPTSCALPLSCCVSHSNESVCTANPPYTNIYETGCLKPLKALMIAVGAVYRSANITAAILLLFAMALALFIHCVGIVE